MMRRLIILILLLPLFITTAYAQDVYEAAAEQTGVYDMERELEDEALDVSGRLKVDGSYDVQGALERLVKKLLSELKAELHSSLSFAAGLAAIAVLCSLSCALCGSSKIQAYVELAGCGVAAAALLGNVDGIVAQTLSSMEALSDYSKAALPALFTASAACGAVSSSAAKYAAVCLGLDILMSAAQSVIIPMINAFLAVSVAGSIFPNSLLTNVSRLTKWLAATIMTALTIAFSAYIGMTGLLTGSVDAVAVKTAKTVISTALPVVGGILSDASSVVLSAAAVIRNSAGIFGLIAVCAMCAGPFVMLSVKMLILRAAAAVTDSVPNARLSRLLESVSTAMGLLLGLLGCCGIMLFISLMAGIKVVSA